MGLFGKKKEVKAVNASQLPELPEPSMNNFLDRIDIPDVPPGLPEEIETKPLSALPEREPSPNFGEIKELSLPKEKNQPMHHLNRNLGIHPKKHVFHPTRLEYPIAKEDPETDFTSLPKFKGPPRTREIDEEEYEMEKPIEIKPPEMQRSYRPADKKMEPVFIRLDKFQITIEAFEEIKSKIIEIEDLLKKTREVKSKEEEELAEWEREIQVIKSRIDSIDRDIFSKLD
jgi:hypothetical protein